MVSTSVNVISKWHKLRNKRDIHTGNYGDTEYILRRKNKKVLSRELRVHEYANLHILYIHIHILHFIL